MASAGFGGAFHIWPGIAGSFGGFVKENAVRAEELEAEVLSRCQQREEELLAPAVASAKAEHEEAAAARRGAQKAAGLSGWAWSRGV